MISQISKRSSKQSTESDKWFWVDKEELKENKYDLSLSKYKKVTYTAIEYEKPEVLLSQIKELEAKILV